MQILAAPTTSQRNNVIADGCVRIQQTISLLHAPQPSALASARDDSESNCLVGTFHTEKNTMFIILDQIQNPRT